MFEQIGEGHKIMAEGPKPAIDLDELERLAKQATPGPWELGFWLECVLNTNPVEYRRTFFISGERPLSCRQKNADYIVAACNALPALIQRVRELEAENAELRKPVDFPNLKASVAHVDNSLSDFLEESIKRAAHRP